MKVNIPVQPKIIVGVNPSATIVNQTTINNTYNSEYTDSTFDGNIPFDTLIDFGRVILTANTVFTPVATNRKKNFVQTMLLFGQGFTPDLSAFINMGSEEFDNTTNIQNKILFYWDGYDYCYRIIEQRLVNLPDLVPMTLSAESFTSITQIAATWNFTTSKAGTLYYLALLATDPEPSKATILADGLTKATLGAVETINISGLTFSTAYKPWYYTENESGTQSDVLSSEFSTIALQQMTAPTITVTAINSTTLRYSVNANVNGVEIYEDGVSGGSKPLYEILIAGDLIANDKTGLEPETTRYVQGIALGDGITTSDSDLSAEVSGTTNELPQLATPIVTAVANGSTQIDSSVVNVANNVGYKIYGADTEFGVQTLLNTNAQDDTTYSETGLISGQTRWLFWEAIANPLTHRNSELGKASATTASTLAGSWPLTEGSGLVAVDASAGAHNGTIVGAAWVGSDLEFDGVIGNDYVRFTDILDSVFAGSGKNFTICAWIKNKYTTGTVQRTIVSKNASLDTQREFVFRLEAARKLNFFWASDGAGTAYRGITGTTVMPTNEWRFVAITFDSSQTADNKVKLYVNSVLETVTVAQTLGTPSNISDTTAPLCIGALLRVGGTNATDNFQGNIKHVRVYGQILSASELQAIQTETTPA